jgi:hypothetical protein
MSDISNAVEIIRARLNEIAAVTGPNAKVTVYISSGDQAGFPGYGYITPGYRKGEDALYAWNAPTIEGMFDKLMDIGTKHVANRRVMTAADLGEFPA